MLIAVIFQFYSEVFIFPNHLMYGIIEARNPGSEIEFKF